MARKITQFALTVRDYDEAINFYVNVLGLSLLEDTDLGNQKRWVRVGPANGTGISILLARAATPEQRASIGNQTGGRVFIFIDTDNLDDDVSRLRANGVQFIREPALEDFGKVAVIEDLYGNKIDLIERRKS